MSVINKMLKDLEQRQEPEVPLGTTGATYQGPVKKTFSPMLLILSLLVVVLLAAVAWLWLNPANEAQSPALLASHSKESLNTNEPPKAVNSEALVEERQNIEQKAVSKEATPKTSLAIELPVSPQDVSAETQTPLSQDNPKVANNTKPEKPLIASTPILPEKKAAQPEVITPPVIKQPIDETENFAQLDKKLKIEKSSSVLTPEQRVERLMEKAQNSFDKGYITEAISQLEEVLSSADAHVKARNLLAVAWYGRGELQQAVNILNDGLNRYPRIEEWRLTAAKIYFKENQLDGAFSYLEANLTGASIEYYSMKGTLGRQLKRFDKAESAYSNLTVLEPEKANWWLGYAIALDSQGKSLLAAESYKVAVEKSGLSQASINFARTRIEELQE